MHHFSPVKSLFTFKHKKRKELGLGGLMGVWVEEETLETPSDSLEPLRERVVAITSLSFINIVSYSAECDSAVLIKSIVHQNASKKSSVFTGGAVIMRNLNVCVVPTSCNSLLVYSSLSSDTAAPENLNRSASASQEKAAFKLALSGTLNDFVVKIFVMRDNKLLLLFKSGLVQVKQFIAHSSSESLETSTISLKLVDIHSYTSVFSQSMVLRQELVSFIAEEEDQSLDQDQETHQNFILLKQIIYDDEKKCCATHDLKVPVVASPTSSFESTVTPLVLPDYSAFILASKPIVAGKVSSSSLKGRDCFYIVDQMGQMSFLSPKSQQHQSVKKLPSSLNILEFADLEKIHNISACSLGNGTVVIASQKQAKTYLTVWDSLYGTLQGHVVLYDGAQLDTPDLSSTRMFNLSASNSTSKESIISSSLLLHTRSTANDSKHSHFTFQAIPFTAPSKTTLLSALGRGSKSRNAANQSIIPISPPQTPVLEGGNRKPLKAWSKRVDVWQKMDSSFLEKLLDPIQTPTVELFTSTFINWICAQNTMIRAWPSATHSSVAKISMPKKVPKSLLYLPPLLLNHQGIQQVLDRCTLSPLSFWPASVVEYLLVREKVVSTSPASSSCSVYSNTLLTVLLQMKEFGLVKKGLDGLGVEQIYLLIDWATSLLVSDDADNPNEASDQAQAQEILFHSLTCFVAKNFSALYLKTLSRMQVFVILEWVRGNLDPSVDGEEKSPLWWVWSMPPINYFQNAATPATLDQIAYEKWTTAIDVFSLIIDSHISLLRLDPALKSLITDLSEHVKRDSFLFTLYNKKLRGPLQACVSPEAIEAFRAKQVVGRGGGSRFGKEWRKMVHQMEIGVGEYAVEVVEMIAF